MANKKEDKLFLSLNIAAKRSCDVSQEEIAKLAGLTKKDEKHDAYFHRIQGLTN